MSISVVRTPGKNDTAATTHNISTGATAGEQIIVCFTNDVASVTASTSSSGWSSLGTQTQGSSTNHRGTVFYKASAAGSDTLAVDLSSAEEATWVILRLSGGTGTPQIAGSNGAAATSITLPTLSLTPTDDYLGISYVGTDSSSTTSQTCTFPAGWGNAQSQNPGLTSSAATFTAEKSFTAASSITPGTATLGTSEQWVAFTIAVQVAPAGGTTLPVVRSVSTGTSTGSATTTDASKPAGLVVNDYLLAFQVCDADGVLASMTAPNSLVEKSSQAGGGSSNYPSAKLWGKVADSTDVATTTFTFGDDSASDCCVILVALEAGTYDPADPIDVSSWTVQARTATMTQTAPSTTGVVNGLLLALFGTDANGTAQAYPTSGTGMTHVASVEALSGDWVSAAVYSEALTSTAATGTRSVTPTPSGITTNGWIATSAVVNPNADAGNKTGSDSGTLTSTAAVVRSSTVTDSGTLSESSSLTVITGLTGSDSGSLSESSSLTVVTSLTGSDSGTLTSTSSVTKLDTFGNLTDGTGSSASSADKTVVSKFTAVADGVLVLGHARIWVTGGSATTKFVVYADSSGPGAKLAESNELVVTATSEGVRNFTFTGLNQAAITAGTDYWLGVAWLDPGTNSVNYSRSAISDQRQETPSYAPSTFGTPTSLTGPIDVYVDTSASFSGADVGTLTEQSALTTSDALVSSDEGTLIDETALVSILVSQAASDTGGLTVETAAIVAVTPIGPSTDSGALVEETAELTIVEFFTGTDAGTLTADPAQVTVFIETGDQAVLTEDRVIDRPGAIFGDQATLTEHSELTQFDFAPPFYFGPDQYFGEDVWWGGVDLPTGVDPTGGVDPDRDGGFTSSQTGTDTPVDYAVLVAITTTGEVIDELAWSGWQYTDTVDWARPGSMTVQVPLLGKDRLGELNRQSLKNINSAGPAVALVLTRRGRALFAGPVISVGWNDDDVEIQCASIAKLMDYRVVIDPAHLLTPGDTAGNVSYELGPRDLVIKLLQLGTTGDRRALPIELPAIAGSSGPLVEYLASDLGTVSERIKEQVEQEGGPDVVIHPELSLDQSRLVWKVQVEQHIGSTDPTAAWDYPVTVKQLTGDTDSSQMVTTGYVLGDTQTSVGSIRGFGVHSIDRGSVPPAMERADRTSVSNKRQDELDALAVSFVEANSHPAETWSIAVHAEADPIIGEQWGLGDNVTLTVTDHPWLDDGEYQRRVTGITHNPETIQLETVEVSREVFPVVPPPVDTGTPPGRGDDTPPPPPEPEPEPEPTPAPQTLGVFGVATPVGAVVATSNTTSALNIGSGMGGTPGNPKVYDGAGKTCGRVNVTVPDVIVQNYRVIANSQYGAVLNANRVTFQNNDVKGLKVTGDGDLNAVVGWGDDIHILFNTADDFIADNAGDLSNSHTDFVQSWKSTNHPTGGARWWIIGNRATGPLNPDRLTSIPSIHQFVIVEGPNRGGNSGGDGVFPSDWVIMGNIVKGSWGQEIKLDGVRGAIVSDNQFIGDSDHVIEVTSASSDVKFFSDNVVGPDYGNVGYPITPGPGPASPLA